MKKTIFAVSLTLTMLLFSEVTFAQTDNYPTPKWVSDNGYWVVKSNINTPKISTIYFYNNSHELVYKEKINGYVINLKRRKVKMSLKKVLDRSVIAYNKTKKAAENDMFVIDLIKH